MKKNWNETIRERMDEKKVKTYGISKDTKVPYNTVKRIVNKKNKTDLEIIANYLNLKLS